VAPRSGAPAWVGGLLLLQILQLRCGSEPLGGEPTPPCETSGPVFLKSKLDDDDGDGNPSDEAFPSINDEDDDIADHAWIQDDAGVFHLFFQNEGHGSGNDIEHYVSADLQSLTYVGVALRANTGAWDSGGLWAPTIVRNGDTFWMFYTGTNGAGANLQQRIGLAVSNDLFNWHRFPVNRCSDAVGDGCVYDCTEGWTTWSTPGSYNQQCRDPFVVWDPQYHRWVLFATARSTNGYGVITVAYSTTLIEWSGAGYIDATRRLATGGGGQPTGGQAENPSVISHGKTHWLLFCDWQDLEDDSWVEGARAMMQYVTSSSLTADSLGSAGWTYRGYAPDPGVNAIEVQVLPNDDWIMSQSIVGRYSGDYPVHRRELRLKRILWGPDERFRTEPWQGPQRGCPDR